MHEHVLGKNYRHELDLFSEWIQKRLQEELIYSLIVLKQLTVVIPANISHVIVMQWSDYLFAGCINGFFWFPSQMVTT